MSGRAPHDDDPPPRAQRFGLVFWAAIAFGVACVLIGLVVGLWGSRLFPPAG